MQKFFILTGSVLGALAVGLGAFGAHALKATLEANHRLDTFNTAVKYHLFHTLAIILIAVLMDKFPNRMIEYSAWSMLAGVVLFSGSLYVLAATNMTRLGMVAPLGGTAFILGWILLFLGILRSA